MLLKMLPQMKPFVILTILSFLLGSCTINEYYYIVQKPVGTMDQEYKKYADIPVSDTIYTSSAVKSYYKGHYSTVGNTAIVHNGYPLLTPDFGSNVKQFSKRKIKRRLAFRKLRSYRDLSNYPKYVYAPASNSSSSGSTFGSYGGSRSIHTGPRGGKYYINKNGNKTYIKRK